MILFIFGAGFPATLDLCWQRSLQPSRTLLLCSVLSVAAHWSCCPTILPLSALLGLCPWVHLLGQPVLSCIPLLGSTEIMPSSATSVGGRTGTNGCKVQGNRQLRNCWLCGFMSPVLFSWPLSVLCQLSAVVWKPEEDGGHQEIVLRPEILVVSTGRFMALV